MISGQIVTAADCPGQARSPAKLARLHAGAGQWSSCRSSLEHLLRTLPGYYDDGSPLMRAYFDAVEAVDDGLWEDTPASLEAAVTAADTIAGIVSDLAR